MSSSKVIKHFSLAEETIPVGSEEFVSRTHRLRREGSPEQQKIKLMEERFQQEKEEAYRNGFADGEMIGLEKGLAEARETQQQLGQVISALTNYRNKLYKEANTQMLELTFAMADRVVGTRSKTEEQAVMETINNCIDALLDKSRVKIKVAPTQIDLVKEHLDFIRETNEAIVELTAVADSRVQVGGCMIETDSGSADARLDNQLNLLKETLLKLDQ